MDLSQLALNGILKLEWCMGVVNNAQRALFRSDVTNGETQSIVHRKMQFSLKLATPIRHWRVFKINAIFTQRWSCSSFVEDVSPRLIFSPCRIRLPSEPGCCTGLCHPKLHWLSRRNLPCLSAGTICIGVLLGSMTKTNASPDGNLKTHMKSNPGCRQRNLGLQHLQNTELH